MSTEANTLPGRLRSYAIRRVNPFLGVLQVVDTGGGRGVSANGVVWDIKIRAERQAAWGSLNQNSTQAAWYRYGLWSQQDGLVTRPLASHLDGGYFAHQCRLLIDGIRGRLEQQPFTLQDNRELWLFDHHGLQPLALLASARPGHTLPSPEPKYWSSCIGANGVTSQRRHPFAGKLEALVKQRAGFNVCKHWITRQDDGSGIIETGNIRLEAEIFPAYLLTEDWPDAEHSRLVCDYIEWISPSLLTLQHLNPSERARLEQNLRVQAESVEHHWHLYPEIIDKDCIKAARVQCRLYNANKGGRTAQ